MSPRHFVELEAGERRRAIARLVFAVAAITVILLVGYYALPPWAFTGGATALLRVAASSVVFVLIVVWLVRRVVAADLPELRAIEVLAIIVPLFLYTFASTYLALSHASRAAFSEPLDHTGALYLAITVFSTVGFGDITPRTDVARAVVSAQMLLDLVLLGAVVRLVIGAARRSFSRTSETGALPPGDGGRPPDHRDA